MERTCVKATSHNYEYIIDLLTAQKKWQQIQRGSKIIPLLFCICPRHYGKVIIKIEWIKKKIIKGELKSQKKIKGRDYKKPFGHFK